jgi:hypothetical protein
MAKSKEMVVQEAEVLSPEQETQALITLETDKLINTSIIELRKSTVTDQALAHLTAEYSALAIAGIDDLNGYKAVKDGASKLKKIRTSIKARREELTEPALKFQRALIAEEKRIVAIIEPLEAELNAKKKDYEDAVEAKKREVYTQRVKALTENGFQLINGFFVCGPVQVHSDELARITEAQMEVHIKHGQSELERKAAEEKRRQEEAERQQREQERLAAERAEIARMRAELEAEKAKVAAEIAAQTQAIEHTYDTVVQPAELQNDPQPVAAPQQPEPISAPVAEAPQQQHPFEMEFGLPQACPTSRHDAEPSEFQAGFDAFRSRLINLVTDPSVQLSRATLRTWAETLQYPQQ